MKIFLIIIFLLVNCVTFMAQSSDEANLLTAFGELNKFDKTLSLLTFRDDSPTSSNKQGIINLNIGQIDSIIVAHEIKNRDLVLLLALCHEYAHQSQFEFLENYASLVDLDTNDYQVIEASADILAGYLLGVAKNDFITDFFNDVDKVSIDYSNLAKFNYFIGELDSRAELHPTRRMRISALLKGFSLSTTEHFAKKLKNLNEEEVEHYGFNHSSFHSTLLSMFESIDYRPFEDVVLWSFRQAKKICKWSRFESKNLVILDDHVSIQFDTAKSLPFVKYDLLYRNIGAATLSIDLEVSTISQHRLYIDPWDDDVTIDNQIHRFTVYPGESYLVRGSLNWSRGKGTLNTLGYLGELQYPMIVFPGSNSDLELVSITNVNPINKKRGKSDDNKQTILRLIDNSTEEYSLPSAFLLALSNNIFLGPMSIADGIGHYSEGRDGDFIKYNSLLRPINNSKSQILINADKEFLYYETQFTIPSTSDLKMKSIYDWNTWIKDLTETAGESKITSSQHGNISALFFELDNFLYTITKEPTDAGQSVFFSIRRIFR